MMFHLFICLALFVCSIHALKISNRPIVTGGNWKLNPTTLSQAKELATGLKGQKFSSEAIVFPPFPYIKPVADILEGSKVKIGAQDVYVKSSGAFTGEVSPVQLADLGVSHVLVGHSERRTLFGDCDKSVNAKLRAVLDNGMSPVLCIGESQEDFESGLNTSICALQLLRGLKGVTEEEMKRIIIAYEPVWAIGTGKTCNENLAQTVHKNIRNIIKEKYSESIASVVPIQYGGSVTENNVKNLLAQEDIDGCLVGGASLKVPSFTKILNYDQ